MKLYVDGAELDLTAEGHVTGSGDRFLVKTADGTHSALAIRKGETVLVSYRGRQFTVSRTNPRTKAAEAADGDIRAPMPGTIVDVRVQAGEAVTKGQVMLVLEAMKTQQPFAAPFDGIVKSLPVKVGQLVAEGVVLVKVVPAKE